MSRKNLLIVVTCVAVIVVTAVLLAFQLRPKAKNPPPTPVVVPIESRNSLATWPWPGAQSRTLHRGVTLTSCIDPRTDTHLYLFRFDPKVNPKLHFEIYDTDEDDATPNDGKVFASENRMAIWAWNHLKSRGQMIALFNGPFYSGGRDKSGNGNREFMSHTAAVVRHHQVYSNVGNPRWGLGVKDTARGQRFFLVQRAARPQLKAFDWGSGNVQALVVSGKPTRLLPPSPRMPDHGSPESLPGDCGPYPGIDYLKTSRTSLGWRKDEFALLVVSLKPGEDEATSGVLRNQGRPQSSGWDIADLQKFWLAWRAQGACNLDGGNCTGACFTSAEGDQWLSNNAPAPVPIENPGRINQAVLLYPYVIERP